MGASRRQILLVVIGLAMLIAGIYWPVARHDFINYDDDLYVYNNPHVATGLSLENAKWAFVPQRTSMVAWVPLTWISHQATVSLFGLRPGAHHLVNVLLHALATILLFLSLLAMTRVLWSSAFIAAIFAVHPLNVEAVAWVSARKDVLSAVFFMLCLLAYFRCVRSPSSWRYIAVIFMAACAMMAKTSAIMLPAVLLLLDYWPLQRINALRDIPCRAVEKVPMFAMALIATAMSVWCLHASALEGTASKPFLARLADICVAYASYLFHFVWPMRLAVFYPAARVESPWIIITSAILLITISAVAVAFRETLRAEFTGWTWYVIVLLPMGGLQVGSDAIADRYGYLPLIGISLAIAFAVHEIIRRRPKLARAAAVGAFAAIAAFASISIANVHNWADSETLFRHAIAITTDNDLAHNNLGMILLGRDDRDGARRQFQIALDENPRNIEAANNLALLLADENQYDEALDLLNRATAVTPRYPPTHYNRGYVLLRSGRAADAEVELRAAVSLAPENEQAQYNLAAALMRQRRWTEAIAPLQAAVSLKPAAADAWNNLGICYAAVGDKQRAIDAYRRALKADPSFSPAITNLGRTQSAQPPP
jgi:protein O-mannosyl-transferase